VYSLNHGRVPIAKERSPPPMLGGIGRGLVPQPHRGGRDLSRCGKSAEANAGGPHTTPIGPGQVGITPTISARRSGPFHTRGDPQHQGAQHYAGPRFLSPTGEPAT